MKIAAITDDGKSISQHFGRAQHYMVVTVEDGRIAGHELRDKWAHGHGEGEHPEHTHVDGPQGHGFDPAAQDTHSRMAASIADCEVVLARGMGAGAYYSLEQAGLRPIITDVAAIDQAVEEYIAGRLVDHRERLH